MPSRKLLSGLNALPAGLAACIVLLPGTLPAADPGSEVLGNIGSESITRSQVEASARVHLRRLELEYQRKRHEAVEMALGKYMAERLLDRAAAEDGSSPEQLVSGLSGSIVTDADIDAFYETNKSRIRGTREQVGEQIREFLTQQKTQQAFNQLMQGLQERYSARTFLEPFRLPVTADGPSIGPADAPVTVVEFSDFECPYCVRIYPMLQEIVQKYEGKVRLVYRQFPLDIHDNAFRAAEASLCAEAQGRFWDMHNAMFDNQEALQGDGPKELAIVLGLDGDKFSRCLDSGRYAEQVRRDLAEGEMLGVTGTPATFVNGRMLSGAVSGQVLIDMIDEELSRK